MKQVCFLFLLVLCVSVSYAQTEDSSYLVTLNQQIDTYVVQKDTNTLLSLYADDFVFSHGSGKIEGRKSWLGTVARSNYPLRQHDSVTVELHPGLGIVKGKMVIQKINKDKTDSYQLKYIRVFAWRKNRWQLISHSTVYEKHE